MKRLLTVLCLLLVVSPAWALFCQYCGSATADDAKFCPKCGKQQTAPSSTPSQKQEKAEPVIVIPESAGQPSPIATPDEQSSAPYETINQYENLLTTAGPERSSGTAAEYRYRISSALQKLSPEIPRFTPAMQRLHNLYLLKYDFLDRYDNACGRSVRGPNRAEADAEKKKLLFTITRTNEMISYLKDRLADAAAPARVDEMQKSLDEAVREHRVTSPYLRVEGYRVKQGLRFWVMDIVDERAMIMVLDDCGSSKALVGWLDLGDLERRTTYRRPASWVAPVQRVETEVVIVGHEWWWPGWPHPRHPRHPGPRPRPGDHDRDRHDRRHDSPHPPQPPRPH